MPKLQSPDIRSLRVGGRCSSISVEPDVWDYLRMIAIERSSSISALMTEIDRTRRLQPARPGKSRVRSLSSAARIFVLENLYERSIPRKSRV
jgi:predicted DNA-binding ribbon-helix-helix protein